MIWRDHVFNDEGDKILSSLESIMRAIIKNMILPGYVLCYIPRAMAILSIKHDLARSCFQFWLKIGDEGDKISRKKTGEALAETVFSRNFVTLGADFEGHN